MPRIVKRPNMFAPKNARSMGEMNVTPFIDVLLVLLIMLIMAVPIKLHVTEVDLPSDRPCPTPAECDLSTVENTVAITASDQLLWNGNPVTRQELGDRVAAASVMEEQPLLRFEPAALASYDTSARTITLIKDSGATRFAFVGNHKYRDWD